MGIPLESMKESDSFLEKLFVHKLVSKVCNILKESCYKNLSLEKEECIKDFGEDCVERIKK